jgi:PIN like domain
MKILFDNGTPKPISRCLAGHEITYARKIGWHELKNGELIQRAEEAGYEVLLSTDKNIQYSRTLQAVNRARHTRQPAMADCEIASRQSGGRCECGDAG